MGTTVGEGLEARREAHWREEERRVDELAVLSAHVSAAMARFVELALGLREFAGGDLARFVACGLCT
jgi:hypothetical protein